MNSLYDITEEMRFLINELNKEDAFDEQGNLNPVIVERLQFTSEELGAKAINYAYVIKTYEDQETAVKNEITRLKALQEQINKRKQLISDRIKDAMIEFGLEKVEGKTLTLKLTKSKAVNVYDESKLPPRFQRQKIIIEPDKIAIKEAILKDGEIIDGAEIKENINLRIG